MAKVIGLDNHEFGKRLRRAREANEVSQSELAKIVGVSQAYISQIESGKRLPNRGIFDGICDAVDLHAGDFYQQRQEFEKHILQNVIHGLTADSVRKVVDYALMVKLWQRTNGQNES